MKIDLVLAGLNLSIVIQKKSNRQMHVLWIVLLKRKGIEYCNVETLMLFAPPLSKFLATRLTSHLFWNGIQVEVGLGGAYDQWRTQKICMGGVSFSCIWWSFLFEVRCLWRPKLMSYSCFQTNVLAQFVGIICIFVYTHSPYFMCHCTECKLLELQVRSKENTLNHTTQQYITAKISCCALKQWSKTHSSLPPSNLQLKNEAALMSCRIRAVEHRKCADGLADTHPGLQCRILLNHTRLENVHKVRK